MSHTTSAKSSDIPVPLHESVPEGDQNAALQEEVIRHLQQQGADSELVRTLYLQELNRVKYMMRAYLRCRLLKIEKFVMHVLDNQEEQEKLSPQELHHAQVCLLCLCRNPGFRGFVTLSGS